ncbi:peptidoglycan DD-metalloendopeptidase family protein [Helicobacter saguini]|uniref:M23 family metallopeptidase n=1 Tax=Helicobacter saguini TaxID=1548018 RepID=A0A347VMG9_9HELI|nr:peptidoglycan DD-metalloendopeptidase family protein [Helicobacter saguini]MWV66252.1 peptidoglycan DD-metalloendopeptidase family protein [Helicobacter saguini]MWV68605.1 peptidoglycan DD-metalloendopeptidase family protein [Helicobacter saguini]MWV71844.1 peptidoglycan DD-metalloendopeptidase family protein [Helicobacter saguini]TLD95999.1 M23 family metallopeptidase [Helicobacter saguini]
MDKQKQSLTITIVDENGSRQFTLARLAQKFIAYGVAGLLFLIIAGYFAMTYCIEKFDKINLAKQEAYREFQSVYEQNSFLQDDIQSKSDELAAMRERVADLEKMMNVYAFNAKKQNAEVTDLSNLDSTQMDTILQIIPNGNPVNLYEMKQKAKSSKEAYVLVNSGYTPSSNSSVGYDYFTPVVQPVRATADGIVESTRENNQKYGYGNLVRLSHVLGFSTAYTNLSNVKVKQGQFVSKGEIIGYTTASPGKNSTSLYYEVRFLSEGLDTLSFIEWDKANFNSIFDTNKNANINIDGLMWALNDIIKLNDISTHLADKDSNEQDSIESKNTNISLNTKQDSIESKSQDSINIESKNIESKISTNLKQDSINTDSKNIESKIALNSIERFFTNAKDSNKKLQNLDSTSAQKIAK